MRGWIAILVGAVAMGIVGFWAATAGSQGYGRGYGPGEDVRGGRGPGMGHGMGRGFGIGRGHGGHGHGGNPVRHRIVRHGDGVPAPYADSRNPLKPTSDVIAAGAKIYAENCATCHGKTGEGDGAGGRDLDPPPANLAFIIDTWIATDGFLLWAISEGGADLKTAMPAFKDTLSETERWQVVHYLRERL
jgi:mono/diheme cytochrome c family protein